MDTASPPLEALRARAYARHDGFLECVENGRNSGDILGLLKVRVRETRKSPRPRGSTAVWFSLPAVRPGRVIKNGVRPMHMQFLNNANRTAAEVDRYATEARDARAASIDAEVKLGGLEPGTAADLDIYATRDRTAAGDRPIEQVTTNMPGTSHKRGAVWAQIERHEDALHTQGADRINVERGKVPGFWAYIGNNPECPADFRDFILCAGSHSKAGKKLDKRRAKIGSPYITNEAREVYPWLSSEFDKFAPNHVGKRPFKFSTSRRARCERHGDLELPHELGEAAHQRIAARLRARIEAYATRAERRVMLSDEIEVEGYLPVVIAYHPPEAANNKRNWHLHFLFHDRAIAVGADGIVHFAAHKARELTEFGMMKRIRKNASDIINDELAGANETVRVTTAKGDDEPQVKLGKGLQRLEEAGDVTKKGLHNRIVSWKRAYQANINYVADRQREIAADDDRLRRRIASAKAESSAERQKLDDERREVLRLREAALETEATARYAAFIVEMAESNLKARSETASRRREAAITAPELAKWTGELCDLKVAQADLNDELGPERAALDHALSTTAVVTSEWQSRRVALVNAFDGMVARAQTRDIKSFNVTMTSLQASQHRASELHRLVAKIHSIPLVVTQTKGTWGVAVADDPDRIVEGADLSAPEIQWRLQRLADQHVKERAVVEAWLTKHGPASAHKAALAEATDYIQEQVARWQNQPVVRQAVRRRQSAASPPPPAAPQTGPNTRVDGRDVTAERIKLVSALIDKQRGSLDPETSAKLAAIASRPRGKYDMPQLNTSVEAAFCSIAAAIGEYQRDGKQRSDRLPLHVDQLRADRGPGSSGPTRNSTGIVERAGTAAVQLVAASSEIMLSQTSTVPLNSGEAPGVVNANSRAEFITLATPRHPVDAAAAAAVGRLFHDADWSPADYWEDADRALDRVRDQAPHRARSATDLSPSPPVDGPAQRPDQRIAANQARAAFAQAQSR